MFATTLNKKKKHRMKNPLRKTCFVEFAGVLSAFLCFDVSRNYYKHNKKLTNFIC